MRWQNRVDINIDAFYYRVNMVKWNDSKQIPVLLKTIQCRLHNAMNDRPDFLTGKDFLQ